MNAGTVLANQDPNRQHTRQFDSNVNTTGKNETIRASTENAGQIISNHENEQQREITDKIIIENKNNDSLILSKSNFNSTIKITTSTMKTTTSKKLFNKKNKEEKPKTSPKPTGKTKSVKATTAKTTNKSTKTTDDKPKGKKIVRKNREILNTFLTRKKFFKSVIDQMNKSVIEFGSIFS